MPNTRWCFFLRTCGRCGWFLATGRESRGGAGRGGAAPEVLPQPLGEEEHAGRPAGDDLVPRPETIPNQGSQIPNLAKSNFLTILK